MKRYLLLALAAFSFLIVAPSAMAIRVRVVDAPTVPFSTTHADCVALSALDPNVACPINDINATYNMSFVGAGNDGCQAAAAAPGASPADIAGFNFCMILQNVTKAPLTGFNFTFIVPDAGLGDDYSFVDCSGVPSNVTSSSCPSAPLIVGSSITLSFAANPGVPITEVAYLFVDFANNPGNASVTVSGPVSVPEPGELGLFGLGLLGIGMGYSWKKRRQIRGIHSAA